LYFRASESTTFFLPFLGFVSAQHIKPTRQHPKGNTTFQARRRAQRTDDLDEKLEGLRHAHALHEVLGTAFCVAGAHRRGELELEQLDQVLECARGQGVLNAVALLHGQLPQDIQAVPVLLP
jgi:hypothetical protein